MAESGEQTRINESGLAGLPRYGDVFLAAFRCFVGQGKRYSCDDLATLSKLPLRNVKAYLAGETVPSREATWALQRALPSEFTDMLLAPARLGLTQRLDGDPPIGPFEMQRDLGREVASLAGALADGRITHLEAPAIAQEFRGLATEAETFADGIERRFDLRGRRP